MYAAAGGASLASRQARQRQRQEKKTQQLQAKLHPPKAVLSAASHGASTPTRSQSRQFHQLPTNYLRTPQAQSRKLSASYTAQSKLLLPIDEGDTQSMLHMRMHTHAHMHHSHSHAHPPNQQPVPQPPPHLHNYQHYAANAAGHHPGRVSPKLVHRHSGSSGTSFHHSHLPKSATATLPLVSQVEATPPTTPSGAAAARATATPTAAPTLTAAAGQDAYMTLPHHDAIIVTPATPMASPGHVAKLHDDLLPESAAEKQPLTAAAADDDDEPMQPPKGPLERKCSVYRMRRSDAFEHEADALVGSAGVKRQLKELQFSQQQQQYEPLLTDEPQLVFKGLPSGRKLQVCAYCEEGICVCEHIECAQGRAAWLERGRRCSVQESQQQAAACHRRWVKRNRIQDASLGGSSDDEDFLGVLRGPSTFANAFLYVGLGTVALGLVIAFVGTGEKGFKTVELRLIGPSLIGLGLICCILRILFCICPSHCISSGKKARKKNGNKVDADHTTSLLRGENKRVSIARGPSMQPKYPITHRRSTSKMMNEGMEALRQIATTSLFMQNEQKPSMNRVVPIIKEPENMAEAPLEMKKLQTALNVCELSDEEDEDDDHFSRHRGASRGKTTNTTANDATSATLDRTTTAANTTKATTTAASLKSNNIIKTTTTTTLVNEKPPSLSAASKLLRQRFATHQQQQSPPQQPLVQQSQSLSSSSTVKDSIDEELLMETSLMVIKSPAVALASEARTSQSAHATNPLPTSSSAPALPPPPTYTGAISRISAATSTHISTSTTTYDLPSATPHSYAAVTAAARPAAGRESLIRGPLGMPLSALTASRSTYALPASAAIPATSGSSFTVSTATTTTISLLPLPAPLSTSAVAVTPAAASSLLPGQVMDTSPCPSAAYASLNLSPPPTSATAPTIRTSTNAGSNGNSFLFPVTLSLPLSFASADSSRTVALPNSANGNFGTSLAPHPVPPVSKFEPELLLSPAKLGQ